MWLGSYYLNPPRRTETCHVEPLPRSGLIIPIVGILIALLITYNIN